MCSGFITPVRLCDLGFWTPCTPSSIVSDGCHQVIRKLLLDSSSAHRTPCLSICSIKPGACVQLASSFLSTPGPVAPYQMVDVQSRANFNDWGEGAIPILKVLRAWGKLGGRGRIFIEVAVIFGGMFEWMCWAAIELKLNMIHY